MTIQKFVLKNGMQVLLEENHAAKVVSFNALVKVGSADESDNEAGICHVIEHMLFKGTPTRPAGTIARDIEAAGGEINAYTSIDQTVFYINMAKRYADRGLEVLADAIQNPAFDARELAREKEVILEEIRREQDNPARMTSEYLFREAFRKHAYGRPIIGSPKTVNSFTREQVLAFYRKWYSPKNTAFVAVGDFESTQMLQQISKIFADFEGPESPFRITDVEPPQDRPRVHVKEMNIQSAYLALGFHVPNITHRDIPALDILTHALGGADSSRFEQEIKERKRLVHNIYAYAFTPKDPGLFVIGAMLADKDAVRVIGAIQSEIEKVQTDPISSAELTRAKINIRSSEIYEKETVGGQGAKIAYFLATAGSCDFESRYYQMLLDVRVEAVRETARRYLNFENCTAVLLVPYGSPLAKSKVPLAQAVAPARIRATKKKEAERTSPRKMQLKNGATLIVSENHNLPLISICAVTLGGTRYETKKTNGIYGLLSRVLTKGTIKRNAVTIAKDIEKMAGHIDGFSGRNAVGVRSEFLSDYLEDGLELFSDVLTNPAFAADEVVKEKRIVLKAIKDQEDALSSLAFAEFLRLLYPKHPYGLRSLGTVESVKRLSCEDLMRCHKNTFRTKDLIISVVGDVNCFEVEQLANKMLAHLPKGSAARPKLKADPRPTKPQEATILKREKQQAHIVLGFQGTTLSNPDRYAMTVLNNVLSGQGGRLFFTLRDKMSLAYSVSSVSHEGVEPGYFAVYIGTEPTKIQTAIHGIIDELTRISSEYISEEELERAKQYLVGTYDLDLQRIGTVAGVLATNELYRINMKELEFYPQRILAVTRDEVLRAAKKYIEPKAYTLAVVKPE